MSIFYKWQILIYLPTDPTMSGIDDKNIIVIHGSVYIQSLNLGSSTKKRGIKECIKDMRIIKLRIQFF